jgi:hypothetical protein
LDTQRLLFGYSPHSQIRVKGENGVVVVLFGRFSRLTMDKDLSLVFRSLLSNARTLLADVVFKFPSREQADEPDLCGEEFEDLYAHRCILAAWSEPFRVMFTTAGMVESSPEKLPLEIAVQDLPYSAFKCCLEYLYSGNIALTMENAFQVLSFAEKYDLQNLKPKVEEFLSQNLSVENCCEIVQAADQFAFNNLRELALNFIFQNFKSVSLQESWRLLSGQLLIGILKRDDVVVECEERVFEALLSWLNFQPDLLRFDDLLLEMIDLIRFPLMHPSYLYANVEMLPLWSKCSAQVQLAVKECMLDAYRAYAIPKSLAISDRIAMEKSFKMKERGEEILIFGEMEGNIICSSSSMSESHFVSNIRFQDDKYWLPDNPTFA